MKRAILFFLLVSSALSAQSSFFSGECTPDLKICAHFAPADMPVSAVEDFLKSAKSSIKIATYNMNVKTIPKILTAKLKEGVKGRIPGGL
jgi:hypothetical protein